MTNTGFSHTKNVLFMDKAGLIHKNVHAYSPPFRVGLLEFKVTSASLLSPSPPQRPPLHNRQIQPQNPENPSSRPPYIPDRFSLRTPRLPPVVPPIYPTDSAPESLSVPLVSQEEMSSCVTRRNFFLCHKRDSQGVWG